MPYTATNSLVLPSTVTGSWPRPRWFDMSMWAKPLDTCMLDVRFREKFQDALAVVAGERHSDERNRQKYTQHSHFVDHCFNSRAEDETNLQLPIPNSQWNVRSGLGSWELEVGNYQ